MRGTGEIKIKACPTPTTLCWKKLKIGSWLQKIKQHCRINFLAIHQWTGVDGIDKLLITKSIAMNFYSYQSTEVGAGCLTMSLRVSWPRSWASYQEPFSSTAGMGYRAGVRMDEAHCFLTSLLGASDRSRNLTGPISTEFAVHPFARSRPCSLHISIKIHCRKKRGNKFWPVWDVLKWMCAVCWPGGLLNT